MIHSVRIAAMLLAFVGTPVVGDSVPASTDPVAYAESLLTDDPRIASIELLGVLESDPANAKARWLLATAQAKLGDWSAVESNAAKAAALGYPPDAVEPLRVRALLRQGKLDKVLGADPAGLSDGPMAVVLALQAAALLGQDTALLGQGRRAEVRDKVTEALAHDPRSPDALMVSAMLAQRENLLPAARDSLTQAISIDDSNAAAWLQLGDIEVAAGDLKAARVAYEAAGTRAPADPAPLIKSALVGISLADYEGARHAIDAARKLTPTSADLSYAQGVLDYALDNNQDAVSALEESLHLNPAHLGALYYYGAVLAALGNTAMADDVVSRLLAQTPNNASARTLLGSIKKQAGQPAEAERLLRSALEADPNDTGALQLLTALLNEQGRSREAAHLLGQDEVISGIDLLVQGKVADGSRALETAIANANAKQGALAAGPLIYAYLKQGYVDRALAVALAQQQQSPKEAMPWLLTGMVYLAKQDPDKATVAFQEAKARDPKNPAPYSNLALISMLRGKPEDARKQFEEALRNDPKNLSALLALSAMDAAQGREQAMLDRLKQAVEAHPQAIKPRVFLARYYLKKGQPDQVPVALGTLGENDAHNPAVLWVLAQSQLARNLNVDAVQTLKSLVAAEPDSPDAHFLYATALAKVQDVAPLREALAQVLRLKSDHLAARVALARLDVIQRNAAGAETGLEILKKQDPKHPDVLALDVLVARLQNDQTRVLAGLEKLFEVQPNTATLLDLSREQWSRGNRAAAISMRSEWIRKHPDDLAARLALARAYAVDGREDLAQSEYRAVLSRSENNVAALNDLAWLLRDKDAKSALDYAERALAVAPNSIDVKDTLAVVLLNNGDAAKALEYSAQCLERSASDPRFLYHNAQIRVAFGQHDEPLAILDRLEGLSDVEFPERAEAMALRERIKGAAAPSPPKRQ